MGRRRLNTPAPFAYPLQPHIRRHGPAGYSCYRQYRNWLRDEFSFRCVYCMRRETWATVKKDWQVDHFIPKSIDPRKALEYDNLVCACASCNHSKAARLVPDPCEIGYGACVEVTDDGGIHPLNEEGVTLIEALGLDAEDYREFRLAVIDLLKDLSPKTRSYQRLLGYPERLPDLSLEPNPPGGNKRPEGINESCFSRKKRGDLPLFY